MHHIKKVFMDRLARIRQNTNCSTNLIKQTLGCTCLLDTLSTYCGIDYRYLST